MDDLPQLYFILDGLLWILGKLRFDCMHVDDAQWTSLRWIRHTLESTANVWISKLIDPHFIPTWEYSDDVETWCKWNVLSLLVQVSRDSRSQTIKNGEYRRNTACKVCNNLFLRPICLYLGPYITIYNYDSVIYLCLNMTIHVCSCFLPWSYAGQRLS